jgi:hypothetical protein
VSGSGRGDIVAFAERLLELLDQGSFQTTYKYAVLLGLMDLCVEHTSAKGAAPTSVTTRQLAEKVLELYWSHTRPFDPERRPDLLQGKTGEAEILQRIRRFRTESAADPSATLAQARRANARGFERLTAFVEWKLIEMPLPRLQFFGNVDLRFVYQIGWDAKVRRTDTLDGFDNRILFVDGASDSLVRLAGLLRPLVQRQWAAMVARLNKLADAQLEEFLFGVDRADLGPIRGPLRELQGGRCFYCDDAIRSDACVDHFLPWARYPDNGIHNLVLADGRCNGDKSAFLAAPEHLARWTVRAVERAGDLAQIASRARWDAHPARTLSIARAIYLRLPSEAKLWRGRGVFVDADRVRIEAVLVA